MFGHFQSSQLRLEVDAPASRIRESLTVPSHLQRWLFPQQISGDTPLVAGVSFTSKIGPITIAHQVKISQANALVCLLSQGIDGYHEWYWGEGWVQSRLEGISLLPLNLGQTWNLLRLVQHLRNTK